jgi:hypothetical protein
MTDSPSSSPDNTAAAMDRREFMGYFSSIGLSGTALPLVLWEQAQQAREPSLPQRRGLRQDSI